MKNRIFESFLNWIDAEIYSSVLWSYGIPNWIEDDGFIAMDWRYSLCIGGVKVIIDENYKDQYYEYKSEYMNGNMRINSDDDCCPKCESQLIRHRNYNGFAFLVPFVAPIISLPIIRSVEICQHCGYKWKNDYEIQKVGNRSITIVQLIIMAMIPIAQILPEEWLYVKNKQTISTHDKLQAISEFITGGDVDETTTPFSWETNN